MKFKVIDLFAGAGGTTSGIEMAEVNGIKIADVIAAINHDEYAIKSHEANHPRTIHFTEDIITFNVDKLKPLLKQVNDNDVVVLWASLECTNFSIAKGGLPRNADSRTLGNHLFRYVEAISPDYILIENVKEFMSWGEVDANGKPISKDRGKDFLKWIKKIKSYGYEYNYKLINSADLGAYTSRIRYFGIFAKNGLPIAFPQQTYSKKGDVYGFPKWKAVKDCLDFSDKGKSIFRDKSLSENTYKRIYLGLKKFIGNPHIIKWLSNNAKTGVNAGLDIDNPLCTVTTQNRLGIVQPEGFIAKYFSASNNKSVNKGNDISEPLGTITTIDHHAFVQPDFLIKYHGTGENIKSLDDCSSTLTTKDRMGVVSTERFIFNNYSGGPYHSDIEKPCGTIVNNPKQNLISVDKFIMDQNYNNKGQELNKPLNTILACKKYHYLISVESIPENAPGFIKQDENGLYLEIYENDSEFIKLIKMFMVENGIVNIYMRMLKVDELLKIQGFPKDYILLGNQTQQKKFIGNAVVPLVVKCWFEALYDNINEYRRAV